MVYDMDEDLALALALQEEELIKEQERDDLALATSMNMDEELIKDIHELAMDHPSIDLVKEDFVADEQYPGKHVLYDGVTADASLV